MQPDQRRRYARHLVLPQIGTAGQEKLLASSALIIGAGGLGTAAAGYLAAMGLGRIGLVDHDRIELSNLQRQLLYETADDGRLKVEAARDRIEEINPEIKVEAHAVRLTAGNAGELIRDFFSLPHRGRAGVGATEESNQLSEKTAPLPASPLKGEEVVIDCSDNFSTRFALHDACYHTRKTLVLAAVSGFAAQLSTFKAHLGAPHPCYRCFISAMPAREVSCAQEGVLGAACGVMGSLQAVEAVKELLGIGESLSGRLLLYDALAGSFRTVLLQRDRGCQTCAAPLSPASSA